jgi:hypothetical protein
MQRENCCYGEIEMLTFNLAKLGMQGELVHGEGASIHDLRSMCEAEAPACESWRFAHNRDHGGNLSPTHGLVPLCLTMDIPDFTRGAWRPNPPAESVDIDLARFGLEEKNVRKAEAQLSV